MSMSSMLLLPPQPNSVAAPPVGGGDYEEEEEEEEMPRRDERFPQWGIQETKEFIGIRTELESDFNVTKRNRSLWELVAAKMREKGYIRTPHLCRTKWKNLIHKFKEETIDPENDSPCPFFEGMREFFAAQEKQLRLPSEAGSSKGRKRVRAASGGQSSEEFHEEEEDENESDVDRVARGSTAQKKKAKKETRQQTAAAEKSFRQPNPINSNNTSILNSILEMLRNFFQQQQKIDMEWMESMEKRAKERALFEQEWRQAMEKLKREKMMMEQARREREEQRTIREESRAEKRDALLTALLNKLIHE